MRDAKDSPERLSLGATFGMSMKMGVSYSMVSTVVEFDENRRIACLADPRPRQVRLPLRWPHLALRARARRRRHAGARELDVSQEKTKGMTKRFAAGKTGKNMEATLARIEELVT